MRSAAKAANQSCAPSRAGAAPMALHLLFQAMGPGSAKQRYTLHRVRDDSCEVGSFSPWEGPELHCHSGWGRAPTISCFRP